MKALSTRNGDPAAASGRRLVGVGRILGLLDWAAEHGGGFAVLDDRVLVLDFQAGNPQAFVEIHNRYSGLAHQVCRRFLPNAQDADEAFQETMIRAFQGLYRFNGRYALAPWIARIAKNVSLDILRSVEPATLPPVEGSPRLGPPLAGIGKIVCIGLNYRDHAEETGAELPAAMLESIREHESLAPGGCLYLPTGTIQAESRILEVARKIFGAANLQSLLTREFPLPDVVARSKAVAQMMRDGIVDLRARGSRLLWRLQVWRCEMPKAPGLEPVL